MCVGKLNYTTGRSKWSVRNASASDHTTGPRSGDMRYPRLALSTAWPVLAIPRHKEGWSEASGLTPNADVEIRHVRFVRNDVR